MLDPITILNSLPSLGTIFKIGFLILLSLYAIFSFMIFNQVRALSKIVIFPSPLQSSFIKFLAFLYFLLAVSLFFLTLVIV